MSRNYHTPLTMGISRHPDNLNNPLGQLDSVITDMVSGRADWPDQVSILALPDKSDWLWFFYNNLFYIRDANGATPVTPANVSYIQAMPHYDSSLSIAGAGAWVERYLCTNVSTLTGLEHDETGVCTLSGDGKHLFIPAGKYRVRAWITAGDVDGFQARLYDHTAGTVALYGVSGYADSNSLLSIEMSWIQGLFEVDTTTELSLDGYYNTAPGVGGFYMPWDGTDPDARYNSLELWRYPTT